MQEFSDFMTYVAFPAVALFFMIAAVIAMLIIMYHFFKAIRLDGALHDKAIKVIEDFKFEREQDKEERKRAREYHNKRDRAMEDANNDLKLILLQNKKTNTTCVEIKQSLEANHLKTNNKKKGLPPQEKE